MRSAHRNYWEMWLRLIKMNSHTYEPTFRTSLWFDVAITLLCVYVKCLPRAIQLWGDKPSLLYASAAIINASNARGVWLNWFCFSRHIGKHAKNYFNPHSRAVVISDPSHLVERIKLINVMFLNLSLPRVKLLSTDAWCFMLPYPSSACPFAAQDQNIFVFFSEKRAVHEYMIRGNYSSI